MYHNCRWLSLRVVDQAVKVCVDQRSSPLLRPGLTHQDVFYTELVQLGSLLPAILSLLESRLPSLRSVGV